MSDDSRGQGTDRPVDAETGVKELALIDASYKPMPSFDAWAKLQVDRTAWDTATNRMERQRESVSSDDLRRAIAIAMRAAAVDTGAIEGLYDVDRGFTISVAVQASAWQAIVQEKGGNVRELFEAQLKAYELALEAATTDTPITEAWIRYLHEVVCAPQETVNVWTNVAWQRQQFVKGRYKQQPNHVQLADGSVHAYAPVDVTPREMHRLVKELRSPTFESAHPVLQAAYVHHSFVAIHPFQDGNGRVARALASVFLYRGASIPLVIFSDQRSEYFTRLEEADADNHQPFVDFVLDRAVDTLNLVTDSLGAAPEEHIADLRTLLTSQGGLSHSEIDDLGYALLSVLLDYLTEKIANLSLPQGVTLTVQRIAGNTSVPTDVGYRLLLSRGPSFVQIQGQVGPPAQANFAVVIEVETAKSTTARFAFIVRAVGFDQSTLDLRLTDVHPDISAVARLRMDAWTGNVIAGLLKELTRQAGAALRGSGYQ